MNNSESFLKIEGHVTVVDGETGEVLVDKDNAVHYENLSVAIVESLISGFNNANTSTNNGFIYSLNLGNGGTTVDASGIITYNPPNVIGSAAQLYNQTYSKVVNNQYSADVDPVNNNLTFSHIAGKAYSDVIVACRLDYSEPAGQLAFDNSNDINSTYAFDEFGLFSYSGQLLTHVIFSPFIKSLNRLVDITYTLRISTLSSLSA